MYYFTRSIFFFGLLITTGLSCKSSEPLKAPLQRVDASVSKATPAKDTASLVQIKTDTQTNRDQDSKQSPRSNWSRMAIIDAIDASKGVVLVDTIRLALGACEGFVSDHKLHNLQKPNKKLARTLKKQCKDLTKINGDKILSSAGTSPFLDGLLLNTSALMTEVQHFQGILSGKLNIPDDAFNREIESRINGFTRHISDIQRGLEPTRQQLETGHYDEAELAGFLGLLEQPETLIDAVAKFVDIRVISPVWSALMTDIRQNILKGRPPTFLRDQLMLRIVRHRLKRIVLRIEALIREDGELAHGSDLYLRGVNTYIENMTKLALNLRDAKTYDDRATVLKQLQRVPQDERKSVRDARELWKNSYADGSASKGDPTSTP